VKPAASATIALMASRQAALGIIRTAASLAAQSIFSHPQSPPAKAQRMPDANTYLKLELSFRRSLWRGDRSSEENKFIGFPYFSCAPHSDL
jgi:hypothetical protein